MTMAIRSLLQSKKTSVDFHYRPDPEILASASSRVGTSIRGKYVIEALLGTGGMACVYRARHRTGHRVALKIVHADLARKLDAKPWVLREGILTNAVDHPSVPRVLDDDTDELGSPMLVMDLHEGETLADHAMRLGHRLPAGRVIDLAEQMLDVLSAVHACGIVHCDVKPDNFLLTGDRVMLLDFGIARAKAVDLPALPSEIAKQPTGTPEYMPPEQAAGRWEWVDARSDLYALGATLHVLLSGRFVRDGVSLRRIAPGVRSVLTEVIDISLSFDPDARHSSAHAMLAAIRSARHRYTRLASGTYSHLDLKTPTSSGRIARAS
jgi:serine/threonine-protein kinase